MVTVADRAETLRIDRSFRRRLFGAVACWTIVGVANFVAAKRIDWYPSLVGALALATAALTLALVLRPANGVAYRWAGTLAVGTLVMRAVTVIEAEVRADTSDFLWLMADQVAITALLAGTYAWGWLHEIKDWHRAHRILDA
jgi:hypothetical protein